ncbi:MAG: hypothetical protein ABI597_06380 [Gammaproteobacteria bacterium]
MLHNELPEPSAPLLNTSDEPPSYEQTIAEDAAGKQPTSSVPETDEAAKQQPQMSQVGPIEGQPVVKPQPIEGRAVTPGYRYETSSSAYHSSNYDPSFSPGPTVIVMNSEPTHSHNYHSNGATGSSCDPCCCVIVDCNSTSTHHSHSGRAGGCGCGGGGSSNCNCKGEEVAIFVVVSAVAAAASGLICAGMSCKNAYEESERTRSCWPIAKTTLFWVAGGVGAWFASGAIIAGSSLKATLLAAGKAAIPGVQVASGIFGAGASSCLARFFCTQRDRSATQADDNQNHYAYTRQV